MILYATEKPLLFLTGINSGSVTQSFPCSYDRALTSLSTDSPCSITSTPSLISTNPSQPAKGQQFKGIHEHNPPAVDNIIRL